jgi:hypothetical protein
VRCAAGGAGDGAIVREVLTASQRAKLDPCVRAHAALLRPSQWRADAPALCSESDRQFYSAPRFVKHVDDTFLAQLTELYRQRIPPGATVLDIGASHLSHLPPGVPYVRACALRAAQTLGMMHCRFARVALSSRTFACAAARTLQTVTGTGLNAEEARAPTRRRCSDTR